MVSELVIRGYCFHGRIQKTIPICSFGLPLHLRPWKQLNTAIKNSCKRR